MPVATISKKYQIVVPRDIRTLLKLQRGAKVMWYPLDDERAVLVRSPMRIVDALRGLGKETWRSLGGTRKYLKRERASWIR